MKLDDDRISTLARMLGVTVKRCRRALLVATQRTDDVASQLRQVALLCVRDDERRERVLAELGVPARPPSVETPAEIVRKTPPAMPPSLLGDVPRRDVESCLADREEWFNITIIELRREARTRGFSSVDGFSKIQLVDLLAWVDWCDTKKVAKQAEDS